MTLATQRRMRMIFDEWARRYAEDPNEFDGILGKDGKPVEGYGEGCAIYFAKIAGEMDVRGLLPKE